LTRLELTDVQNGYAQHALALRKMAQLEVLELTARQPNPMEAFQGLELGSYHMLEFLKNLTDPTHCKLARLRQLSFGRLQMGKQHLQALAGLPLLEHVIPKSIDLEALSLLHACLPSMTLVRLLIPDRDFLVSHRRCPVGWWCRTSPRADVSQTCS